MTGQADNLRVLTDHINDLAAKQTSAAGGIKIAGEAVGELAANVWATHGVVCAASNLAVAAAEAARDTADSGLWRMSADLSERLTTASSNYNNADWVAGKNITACRL
jgi:hypothetical protein